MRDLAYLRRVNNPPKREPKERLGDKLGQHNGDPENLRHQHAWDVMRTERIQGESVRPGANVFTRESDCGLVREVCRILDAAHKETAPRDLDPRVEARNAAP